MRNTAAVGVRLTSVERKRVEELAERTGRTVSGVIRLLLAQAVLEEKPDIRLKPEVKEQVA